MRRTVRANACGIGLTTRIVTFSAAISFMDVDDDQPVENSALKLLVLQELK
jgi:hypothetical protein